MVTFLAWWTVAAVIACSGITAWVMRHNAHFH